ncbi:MAG: ATP/GTP-binding protein [Cocleimonas sp.]|nr:ATP/GTP-binding protein [Cocleimonas sp.]
MSLVNKKIIFTGPVGAGKTTAIEIMSDIPIISTNEEATDMTKERKPQTTVAMDYGRINIGKNEKIHLYGTPGQERFSFMWDILTEGALGLILLLDNSRENPKQDLKFYTQSFQSFIDKGELVIGITRLDEIKSPSLNDYRNWAEELKLNVPIFAVDARQRTDISSLLQALLYSIDPGVAAA